MFFDIFFSIRFGNHFEQKIENWRIKNRFFYRKISPISPFDEEFEKAPPKIVD